MCMSTTGFGPQALQSLPQLQQYNSQTSPGTARPAADADARADGETLGYGSGDSATFFGNRRQQQQQQQQQPQRRPIPRFDMNLKDLFSDDETDKRSFSRVSNQVNAMRPPPAPMKTNPQLQQPFTADLKISPQFRSHQQTSFFAASPEMTSPNQQNNFSTTPPANPPLPSPYQVSSQLSYNSFSQNMNSSYPDLGGFSDLDFLDSFPIQGSGGSGGESNPGGMQDVGIAFGMGFGDGTHDWSDGNGLDLFDGFFFGKLLPPFFLCLLRVTGIC